MSKKSYKIKYFGGSIENKLQQSQINIEILIREMKKLECQTIQNKDKDRCDEIMENIINIGKSMVLNYDINEIIKHKPLFTILLKGINKLKTEKIDIQHFINKIIEYICNKDKTFDEMIHYVLLMSNTKYIKMIDKIVIDTEEINLNDDLKIKHIKDFLLRRFGYKKPITSKRIFFILLILTKFYNKQTDEYTDIMNDGLLSIFDVNEKYEIINTFTKYFLKKQKYLTDNITFFTEKQFKSLCLFYFNIFIYPIKNNIPYISKNVDFLEEWITRDKTLNFELDEHCTKLYKLLISEFLKDDYNRQNEIIKGVLATNSNNDECVLCKKIQEYLKEASEQSKQSKQLKRYIITKIKSDLEIEEDYISKYQDLTFFIIYQILKESESKNEEFLNYILFEILIKWNYNDFIKGKIYYVNTFEIRNGKIYKYNNDELSENNTLKINQIIELLVNKYTLDEIIKRIEEINKTVSDKFRENIFNSEKYKNNFVVDVDIKIYEQIIRYLIEYILTSALEFSEKHKKLEKIYDKFYLNDERNATYFTTTISDKYNKKYLHLQELLSIEKLKIIITNKHAETTFTNQNMILLKNFGYDTDSFIKFLKEYNKN